MKRQKVCIIGGGLTGLITAITLSKLNLEIDLVVDNVNQSIKSNRTTAISQDNYDFLKKLKFFQFSKKVFWPCSKMKLYAVKKNEDFHEIFELNKENKSEKSVLYMMHNKEIIKYMLKNIKKEKLIKLTTQKKVSEITSSKILKKLKFVSEKQGSKYNLVISCTGKDSNLNKKIFDKRVYERSYDEASITTVVEHNFIKNNIARQIFLNNEILALLPISNTRTSIVWSIKKNQMNKYRSKANFLFKKKIEFYTKKFFKKMKFVSNIEVKNLNLFFREQCFKDRILLFGDALHVVHPLAGQGFNMILRDLVSLEKMLSKKINLGLDIGSNDMLSEFSGEIKPRNFIYSFGIDFIRSFFSLKGETFRNFRNILLSNFSKNNVAKETLFNLADKGFKF